MLVAVCSKGPSGMLGNHSTATAEGATTNSRRRTREEEEDDRGACRDTSDTADDVVGHPGMAPRGKEGQGPSQRQRLSGASRGRESRGCEQVQEPQEAQRDSGIQGGGEGAQAAGDRVTGPAELAKEVENALKRLRAHLEIEGANVKSIALIPVGTCLPHLLPVASEGGMEWAREKVLPVLDALCRLTFSDLPLKAPLLMTLRGAEPWPSDPWNRHKRLCEALNMLKSDRERIEGGHRRAIARANAWLKEPRKAIEEADLVHLKADEAFDAAWNTKEDVRESCERQAVAFLKSQGGNQKLQKKPLTGETLADFHRAGTHPHKDDMSTIYAKLKVAEEELKGPLKDLHLARQRQELAEEWRMAVSAITGALISAADSKFHLAEQSLNASRDVLLAEMDETEKVIAAKSAEARSQGLPGQAGTVVRAEDEEQGEDGEQRSSCVVM